MTQPAGPASRDNDEGDALRTLSRAIDLQQRGKLDDAERTYASLLARNDRDPTILVNAGLLSLARGDVAQSIARLSAAVELVPSNPIAHGNLGLSLVQAGRFDEALAALDRAIALKPDFAHAHNHRGIALVRLERRAEARQAFARALQLLPAYAEAARNLANLDKHEGNVAAARDAIDGTT